MFGVGSVAEMLSNHGSLNRRRSATSAAAETQYGVWQFRAITGLFFKV